MTLSTLALAVAAVTLLSGHVAPSVDDNNRYLKVTPLADGFRLAYTVFFGEIPGAAERRKLDLNRDGRIAPAEAQAFADRLSGEVRDSLVVETDGTPQRVEWMLTTPGLGSDAVAAGSFSIDLIAYLCVPTRTHRRHRLVLRDQFRVPRPGETEVKVEDGPGITVHVARIGPADDPSHEYKFVGPGGPLSDIGLELEWTAAGSASMVPAGRCHAAPRQAGSHTAGYVLAGVFGAAFVALAIYFARRRERYRRRK